MRVCIWKQRVNIDYIMSLLYPTMGDSWTCVCVCVCSCFQREWPYAKEESISRIQMMKMRVGVVHVLSDLFKNLKIHAVRVVVVLLLAEVCKVCEGCTARRVTLKLSCLHAHNFLSTNELTLSSPFDLLRPSQELQSVSWGTAAHHQIRSIVSHLLFCHFLSSCLGFSVLTHQT